MKKLNIDADPLLHLIAEVGKPITRLYVKPVDLLPHVESLRELIEHAKGAYLAEVDEWKDRHDRKYKEELDDNFDADEVAVAYDDIDSEPRITPRMATLLKEYQTTTAGPRRPLDPNSTNWAELYARWYKFPEGNPATRENKINPGGPRPGYLRPIYKLVKWWWEEKAKLGKFQPDFAGIFKDDESSYDLDWANSPARLLHLIVLECDPGYRIGNSANLQPKPRAKPRK